MTAITRLYEEVDNTNFKGLHTPEATSYLSQARVPIPASTIRHSAIEGRIHVEFEDSIPAKSTGYSIVSRSFAVKDVKTLVHDFTLEYFTIRPEERLSKYFDIQNDEFDQLTPDHIHRVRDNKYVVLEFTTSRTSSELGLKKAFQTKIESYQQALINRLDKCSIMFIIVAVSRFGVLSNADLTQEDVDELCLRYRTALDISSKLTMDGFNTMESEKESQMVSKVRSSFNFVKFLDEDSEENREEYETDTSDDSDTDGGPTRGKKKVRRKFMSSKTYKRGLQDADSDYISKILTQSMVEAKQTLREDHYLDASLQSTSFVSSKGTKRVSDQQGLNNNEAEYIIQDYLKKAQEGERRSDAKSIAPCPYWIMLPGTESVNLNVEGEFHTFEDIGNSNDPTFQAWHSAIFEVNAGCVDLIVEDPDLEIEIALGEREVEPFKLNKLKYHRVKVDLDDHVAIELAKVGVQSKAHLEDIRVSTYRDEKKKPFSLNTDIDDIDNLLDTAVGFSNEAEEEMVRTRMQMRLISKAYDFHGSPDSQKNINFYNYYCNSILGRLLIFWSDVCTELSLSLKQHCVKDEFIIKKLKSFNCYLLIKPTSSTKHIFYSLLSYNKSFSYQGTSTVFKSWKTNGIVSWTEFSSMNASKLVNGVKADSVGLSMLSFWLEFYKIPFWMMDKNMDTARMKDVWTMTLLCVLIHLNDKTRLEEQITLSRFIFMESFVCTPCIPKPHKMVDKFSQIPRGRLEVWIIKKLIAYTLRITGGYNSMAKSTKSGLEWDNLWNPYTNSKLEDPHQVINLMYLGYLKNKDESAEANTLGQLYEKILKYENMRPPDNTFLGLEDPSHPNFHEYSPSLITAISDVAKTYLRKQIGNSWQKAIEDEILMRLSQINLVDVCTLKASSKFNEEHYIPDENPERVHRQKVLEVLPDYITDEVDLADIMPRVIEELTKDNYLHIDIFRKPQHGGLREIYVLGIRERLCQLIVETIARAIASFFPSETMTHPENKFKIPEYHSKKASKHLGSNYITVATSDDASKWNQAHFVGKFSQILCLFTPKYMHPTIFRITSLWMKKRIMIDPLLMKIIMRPHMEELSNEGIKQLRDAFWGKTKPHWMRRGKQYIQTTTGMLQGIFHYGSTLLHTFYLMYLKSYAQSRFTTAFKQIGDNQRVIISTMQSSDDSSMIISFGAQDAKSVSVGLMTAASVFYLKKYLSKYLAIYDSIKSTSMTPFCVEFNSEFFFYKNLMRPTFRWVAALGAISEQESIAGRQEELSTLLTSVLEGGASYGLTSLCQLSQAMLHYRLLGMSVSSIGALYFNKLLKMPDPALGFFLLDPVICAGLPGFNFNLWRAVKMSSLGIKYKMLLMTAKSPGRRSEFMNITTAGSIVQSTMITWGNRKKWQRIFDNLDVPEDWKEQINENPRVLYVRPENVKELKLKLAAKAASPGVSTSLSKGNVISRVIAASAYSLSRALSVRGEQMLVDEEVNKRSSLYYLLCRDLELEGVELTNEDEHILFPRLIDHQSLQQTLEVIPKLDGYQDLSPVRKVRTTITVTESDPVVLVKPVDILKREWFAIDEIPAASRVKAELWRRLQASFPWVRSTPEETLKESPFDNHIQIQNFFARLEHKIRRVKLSGVPIKVRHGLSNVTTSIYQNRFHGFKVATIIDTEAHEKSRAFSLINQKLYLAVNAPFNQERKVKEVSTILADSSEIAISSEPSLLRSRKTNLSLIQKFLRSENDQAILEIMRFYKLGVQGFFTQTQQWNQRKRRYDGEAIWRGMIGETNVSLSIVNQDLKSIRVNTLAHTGELNQLLPRLLDELFVRSSAFYPDSKCDARLHDGKIISKTTLLGAPVVVIRKTSFVFDPKKIGKLYIDVDTRVVRLISSYASNRNITIISASIPEPELRTLSLSPKEFKEPTSSWLNFRSLEHKTAASLCKYGEDTMESLGFIFRDYKIWLRELFLGAAEQKQILSPFYIQEYDLFDDNFDLDDLSVDFQQELDFLGIDILEEGKADLSVVEQWPDDVSEFARIAHPAETSIEYKLAGHPLLVAYISHLREKLGSKELSKIINEKSYTTIDKVSLNQICYFLNISIEELTEDISEEPGDIIIG